MTTGKAPEGTIEVRATVNLAGLRAGNTAFVDPDQPYIAELLKARLLLPVEGHAHSG